MSLTDSAGKFAAPAPSVSLKKLEDCYLYDAKTDELYEINDEAFDFLRSLDGQKRCCELEFDEKFFTYCVDEGLIDLTDAPGRSHCEVGSQADISLRYLLVSITTACNLRCRHCYVGDVEVEHIDPVLFEAVADEFARMGGMRFIISGGEPVLHPEFARINDILEGRPYRRIMISNGIKLNDVDIDSLNIDEIQVSLDGLEPGHDWLRGHGTFEAVAGVFERIKNAGIDLSIATVIHKRNVAEFDTLEEFVRKLGATSWTIDYPSATGRAVASDLFADLSCLEPIMALQFGAQVHAGASGLACGAHLAAISPDGVLTKCGFYRDWNGGQISALGLERAWSNLDRIKLEELDCDCENLQECKGGCRFRAQTTGGSRYSVDPVRCKLLKVDRTTF